jgi:hypothetical protein
VGVASMIFQPQGIDGGTLHCKFLRTEFPEIVSDQVGGSLGLHECITIQLSEWLSGTSGLSGN